MPNRLAASTSPYLVQHQHNPVDWWEWSEEAFAEARRRDVPLLISVGYAACHWCHVMAHESFEDPSIAAVMNGRFVNVKVDREERPDVDAVYMEATQAMTGHGGWPTTVFATPAGEPFFCGTYYPPAPRHGMASFGQVLDAVSEAWSSRRAEVLRAGGEIVRRLGEQGSVPPGEGPPTPELLAAAVRRLQQEFDPVHAGFGRAPKFPPSMVLEFLLRHAARAGGDDRAAAGALELAERTFEAMARGGMYDQLGGGFARYSVDERWLVPHFEKMLYDNALLLRAYTHWWRQTGSPLARRVAAETADFLVRDLRTPQGGFASSLDADSEGEEGRYYVWTPKELREVLGDADGEWAAEQWQVSEDGTFEHGSSVLQLPADPEDVERYASVRTRLLVARAARVPPGRDDKVVAAWNGLAIAALAEAGALLGSERFVEHARTAAALLDRLHLRAGPAGLRLVRTSREGTAGRHAGVLEDYADVAEGFLALYAVTGEQHWLDRVGALLATVLASFGDGEGGFYDTAEDAEQLVRRPREVADNATPAGWSAAAGALLTYAAYTGEDWAREAAERALRTASTLAPDHPRFAGWALSVSEAVADGPREVAVVGPLMDPATRALHRTALA
ncbi:MAG: thioredoxin domain-containing protein, partial [Actinomycetota bacterium]|nr:thioredoxin domain-containing protein [Actinomycetota bacterium]